MNSKGLAPAADGGTSESRRIRDVVPLGVVLSLALLILLLQACSGDSDEATESAVATDQTYVPFPDFGFLPPVSEYTAELFQLSDDFPTTLPGEDELPDFLDIDFSTDEAAAIKYLEAVRDYAFEGNVDVDFRVENNTVRDWYHMPWQHYGDKGREGIHGLTREAVALPQTLANTQLGEFTTYAVGFYNSFGGYTIGQSFANPDNPQAGFVFPEGTVVFKLLFTEAGQEDGVEYLANPQAWDAYIYEHVGEPVGQEVVGDPRSVQQVNLIQMDIMVRDDRTLDLSGTGWVFGTFVYNGTLNANGGFDNLVPLGLQWGDDPELTDVAENPTLEKGQILVSWDEPTPINTLLQETVINTSTDVPYSHLGWGGRLSGPVDNFESSCQSCHATAQWPVASPLSLRFQSHPDEPKYEPGGSEWNRWFRNLPLGESFDPQAKTTDNILQLQIALSNFYDARSVTEGGQTIPGYNYGGYLNIDGYPNGQNNNGAGVSNVHSREVPEE